MHPQGIKTPRAGLGRRDFLRVGSLAALGSAPAWSGTGQNVSCILIWQEGGASHLDTFDMKPQAPPRIRGPFRDIPTSAPSIRICEHLPRLARQMDKVTLVRSMQANETNHERAAAALSGTLPAASVLDPATARRALDLDSESPSLRDRYGRTPLGEACLRARRMVQHGARMVRVVQPGYDAHADHFQALRERVLPAFDRAFAALLEDLEERRLLGRILVVAAGEFGRSPRINAAGGRDHHARAWSVCLAGAGLPGGRVIGATDAWGAEVVDSPVRPQDLVASVYTLWDPAASYRSGGRAIPRLLG